MTETTAPNPPPAPPRPITARARQRAWAEAPVRLWWLSAVVIGLIALYVAATQISGALADRRLIEQGHVIDAKVIELDQSRSTMMRPMDRSSVLDNVLLQYDVPGSGPQEARGRLDPRPGETVRVGQTLQIRVDPANPRRWTDRTRARSWLAEMTSVALLAPLVVLLLIVAFVRRAAVLRVWRNEPSAEAVVVDAAHSAMAPRSRTLRMTLTGGADNRVFTTLYPVHAGVPAVGETVWVVAPKGRPGKAVVARLYE